MVATIPVFYDVVEMPPRQAYNIKEPNPGTLGHYVRQRRSALKMSQQELADRIEELGGKMKQGDVSDLELSDSLPRPAKMQQLAQALEVPLGKLYAEAGFPAHIPDDDVLDGLDDEGQRQVRTLVGILRGEHPDPQDLEAIDRRIDTYKKYVAGRPARRRDVKE